MVSIILSWIFITCIVFPFGFLLNEWISSISPGSNTNRQYPSIVLVSGLMVCSFACTLISLFMPLDLTSNIILVISSIAIVFLRRKSIGNYFTQNVAKGLRETHIGTYLAFLLVLIFSAYGSYQPSSHHDDGMYYSTTIKWLQEYGTVKGLGNLNPHIAFNSAWHILQANFGFRFLNIGLFNDMNGLLYVYVFLYALGGINNLLQKKPGFANVLRALFFIPVLAFYFGASSDLALYNVNFISSSSPDVPVCMLIWLTFVYYLDKNRSLQQTDPAAALLVILLTIWIITIKLSALPIALLSTYIIITNRHIFFKPAGLAFLLACSIGIVPWIVRNVYLSGYLVFPFAGVDVFDVDWKIGIEVAKAHQNAIKVFALGEDLNKPFTQTMFEWFPAWVKDQIYIRRVILFATGIATLSYLVIFGLMIFKRKTNYLKVHMPFIICNLVLLSGILFWLSMAPDFRFGYGFLCIYNIIFIALVCHYFLENDASAIVYPLFLYLAYLGAVHYKSLWNIKVFVAAPLPYRMPTDPRIEVVDNIPVTVVQYKDSWNAPLPAANENEFTGVPFRLRGKSLKEGFKTVIQK